MQRERGDIRVIGEVAGTHVLEDIGRDVPQGVVVTIPGDLAVRSRDLYRAIAQKFIRCLNPSELSKDVSSSPPVRQTPVQPLVVTIPVQSSPVVDNEKERLSAQVKTLATENQALKDALQQTLLNNQKLDTILAAIQNMPVSGTIIEKPRELGAVIDAPVFIPSQIRPDDVSVRVDVQGETAQSEVSDVLSKLRKFRKG